MNAPSRPLLLVVDSDVAVHRAFAQAAKEVSFDFVAATSAEGATMLVKQREPQLVVTDIFLPGMDGVTMACHIQAFHPTTFFALYSDRPSYTTQAQRIPLLQKPCSPEELVTFLRGVKSQMEGAQTTEADTAPAPSAVAA